MSASESKPSHSVVRVLWLHKLSRLQLVVVLLSTLVAATAIGIWMRHVSDRQHSAIGTSLQTEKGSASPGVASSAGHGGASSSTASSAAPTASRTSTQSALSSSASGATESANANASTGAASSSRMVIKSAQVRLVVSNVNHVSDHLTQSARAAGGFVQSLNKSSQDAASQASQPMVSLVVRIPDTKFSSFLNTVKSLGTVQSLSQSGVDVTQQNNNFQDELQQLQSEEKAYTRLFQQAKSMKDMLQIQSSLTQVNNEIATVQQQLHNLHRSVALSTVSLTLTQKTPATVRHAKPLWGALLQSLAFMKTSALGLVAFLAWILPWGILFAGLFLGWRYIRHLRRSKS